MANKKFKGNFDTYEGGSVAFSYGIDEEVVQQAGETMFSMTGNPGQERLIGDFLSDFSDWANEALEAEGAALSWNDFAAMVRDEWYNGDEQKWNGTDIIWSAGYDRISFQSGWHDRGDEAGEGKGEEF